RLTASHDWPVTPNRITPGSIVRLTLVSEVIGWATGHATVEVVCGAAALGAVKPPSQPTSTRPWSSYSRPGTRGSVIEVRMTRGSVHTRQVPSGPVIVPEPVRPCGSSIAGHPAAGATTAGPVGVGVGAGVGAGLLMVMFPPVPGEARSSGPQAASASTLQPSTSERER